MRVILFIVSEILFFVSFFRAFVHRKLSPTIQLGSGSIGIQPFIPFQVPLLNTTFLLDSQLTATWAHHSLLEHTTILGTEENSNILS